VCRIMASVADKLQDEIAGGVSRLYLVMYAVSLLHTGSHQQVLPASDFRQGGHDRGRRHEESRFITAQLGIESIDIRIVSGHWGKCVEALDRTVRTRQAPFFLISLSNGDTESATTDPSHHPHRSLAL
jgi:hypothetical protein